MSPSIKPQVTLYLPGLLCNYMKETALSLPSLFKILSQAHKSQEKISPQSLDGLFSGLGREPLPSGALMALGQGAIQKDNEQIWCLASLMECLVTHQTAYLIGNDNLQLREEQAKRLIQALNELLNQDALSLQSTSSLHWLCRVEKNTQVSFSSLWEVLHKHLLNFLPKGPDSLYWQRLLTECQMLLETSSVTKERQAAGLAVASSLWFWGMGKLPESIQTPYDIIYTEDDILKGLGILANCQVKPLELAFQEKIVEKQKNILIADMSFYQLYCEQLQYKWEQRLQQLEQNGFTFLLQALQKGKIEKLHLLTDEACYSLSRINLLFFWRKVQNPMINLN